MSQSFSKERWAGVILTLICANSFSGILGASGIAKSDQLSRVLNDLLKKPYDKRVRPLYDEGPLFVRIGVYVESISELNEDRSELTFTATIRQTWLEPRLTFTRGLVANDSVQIIPEQTKLLWVPNTVVANQRKSSSIHEGHESTRLISEGQVSTTVRMTITSECVLQYSYFPFDIQTCDVQFSSYTKEVVYEWDDENSGVKVNLRSSDLQLISYKAQQFAQEEGRQYSTPIFTFIFVRNWYSYYLTFYSPMLVFTLVSLSSLWLFNSKMAIVINFVNLPLMNIFMAVGKSVAGSPRVAVSTSMDQFASLCYYFVFFCVIVSTADLHFERQANAQKQKEQELKDKEEEDEESTHFQPEEGTKSKSKGNPKLQAILSKVKLATRIVCSHSYWILLSGFLLFNVFYWGSNFSGQKSRIKSFIKWKGTL